MKKKMVKLLSVVMLISMILSMTTAGAFALVEDGNGNTGIIIGGSADVQNSSSNGGLTIGADMRPSDDSPYDGVVVENTGSGVDYDTAIAEARSSNAAALAEAAALMDTYAAEYIAYDSELGDGYSGIDDSELAMVQENKDFLKYVRDNQDTIDSATLQTAVDLFGEEAVYGTDNGTFDSVAASDRIAVLQSEMAVIENAYLAEPAAEETEAEETPAAEAESGEEAAEDAETAEEAAAPVVVEKSVNDLLDPDSAAFNQEYYDMYVELNSIQLASKKYGASTMSSVDVNDPQKISSLWGAVCGTGSSLADAVRGGATLTFVRAFDICNTTDYRITIDLCGSTINATAADAAFVIRGKTISFTNGTINGDGFYVCANGVLNLGGLINTTYVDITVNAKVNAVYVDSTGTCVIGQGTTLNGWLPASDNVSAPTYSGSPVVYVAKGGTVRMTGGVINAGRSYGIRTAGTLEISSSVAEVNSKNGYPAIYIDDGSKTDIHAGVIYGSTGIVTAEGGNTTLTINGGSITGYGTYSTNYEKSGAAIEVQGDGRSSSAFVYANGGTLRSEYSAGVVNLLSDGTRIAETDRKDITHIAVDDVNVTIQEAAGKTSDYAKCIFLAKDSTGKMTGHMDLASAVAAAGNNGKVTMVNDWTVTAKQTVSTTNTVTIDGNGHTINFDLTGGVDGIEISGGTVTLQNISLNGSHGTTSGIKVTAGTVNIGDNVYVDRFDKGLHVTGGTVKVTGLDIDDDTVYGIYCEGGTTTVAMCKVDSAYPVYVTGGTLKVSGGWFLYKAGLKIGPTSTATPDSKSVVSSYVDPDVSYVKYVEADKYYEVLYLDTPTVEIVSGSTGYDTDGTPYVSYNKADPDPIIFNIEPYVTRITAVSKTDGKTSYNLFTAEAGQDGNIRIPDSAVLNDCPSGAYDLQFTFKNGYVLKGKLNFYVFPKVAKIFDVPNTSDYTLTMTDALIKRLTSDYEMTTSSNTSYDVNSQHNIAVVMSELPDKICIGNDPDGSDEILLENFNKGLTNTYTQITSGTYAGNYLYYISYADLNNLAVGQNYVFLEWDGTSGALKRLPFKVTNSAVSISPTSLDWSNVSTYANFTVKPGVDTVYIDGNKVEEGYWTYDTSTHVLSIKGSYLNALESKEHTLEVITPQGKVSATLNTGVGLVAKGVDYHVYGGARALSFVASDVINQDAGIWIGSSNPTRLDSSAYTWDSKTGFTLNAAFLNRLSLGTYYISCYVYNGSEYEYTTTTFRVISASQAAYTPSTGDNSNIFAWAAILVLSGVAIVVIVLPRMKRKPRA